MSKTSTREFLLNGYRFRMEISNDSKAKFLPHGEILVHYQSGVMAHQGKFVRGVPHGTWLRWYQNGTPMSRHSYVMGRLHGGCRQYYENGTLARQGFYDRGRRVGVHKTWNPDGSPHTERQFRRNNRHNVRQWLSSGHVLEIEWRSPFYRLLGSRIKCFAKKVCAVDYRGTVNCLTLDEIVNILGLVCDPESIENVLKSINDLYGLHGIDSDKPLLVGCAGGLEGLPIRERQTVTTASARDIPKRTVASTSELEDMTAACQAANGLHGRVGLPINKGGSVQAIVEKVDDQVAACDDRGRRGGGVDPIADEEKKGAQWELELEMWKKEKIREATLDYVRADHPFMVPVGGGHEVAARNSGFNPNDNGAAIMELLFTVLALAAAQSREDEADRQRAADNKRAAEDAARAEAERKKQEEEKKKQEEEKKKAEEELTPEEKEAQQCLQNSQCTENDGSEPAPQPKKTGMPDPGGDYMSCESIERRWEFFKEYCEQSNWQDYRCQSFLRVANNCVDASLILPGPDGDLTCPDRTKASVEEAQQLECERKKQIWASSGFGDGTCRARSMVNELTYDLCNDPRAELLPDQCLPHGDLKESPVSQRDFDRAAMRMPESRSLGLVPPAIRSVNEAEFDGVVGIPGPPVLVAFVSHSCAPCHRTLSQLAQHEASFRERVLFVQADVNQNPSLRQKHGITFTPTLIVFNGGEVQGFRRVGAASPERLMAWIDKTIDAAPTSAKGRDEPE